MHTMAELPGQLSSQMYVHQAPHGRPRVWTPTLLAELRPGVLPGVASLSDSHAGLLLPSSCRLVRAWRGSRGGFCSRYRSAVSGTACVTGVGTARQ